MTLADVLPSVRQLPAKDKIRLIRILAEELDETEHLFLAESKEIYQVQTPYGAFGAGRVLMDALAHEERGRDPGD